MEWIYDLLGEIILSVLGVVLTFFAGKLATVLGKGLKEKFSEESIMTLAHVAVSAVEMMYRGLGGEEKMEKAISILEKSLAEKKIFLDGEDMRVVLESAVAEFKEAYREA